MIRYTKGSILVLSGLLALSASSLKAHAGSETFTAAIANQTTDFTDFLKLNQFNPTLGVLQSVTLTYDASSITSGTIMNSSSKTGTFNVTDSVETDLLDLNPTTNLNSSFVLSPGQSVSFSATASASQTKVYTTPAQFTPFIGVGQTDIEVDTTTNFSFSGPGNNANTSISTTAGGEATVTYNYSPIPEASTLLGFGSLLGLGGLRLRRRLRK